MSAAAATGGAGRERRSRRRRRQANPAADAEMAAARAAARRDETRIIHDRLALDVRAVLDRFMPGADWTRQGGRGGWVRCGGLHGGSGTSFRVSLDSGFWQDFSSGESGSLIDLIQAVEGGSLAEAFASARAFLGMADESPEAKARAEAAAERAAAAREERRQAAERAAAEEREKVRGLWKRAREAYCFRLTPAERYFTQVRGIAVPQPCRMLDLAYWDTSRDTPRQVGTFPAVVTPFVSERRTIEALHLTYLDPRPPHGKLDPGPDAKGEPMPAKKFLGTPPDDAWIRLTEARPVMAVGEGIETVATATFLKPDWGGWVAGSVDRLALIRFPPIVERVVVLGECGCAQAKGPDGQLRFKPDGAPLIPAEEATYRAARAYAALPHKPEVEIKWFQGDLNDVLRATEG